MSRPVGHGEMASPADQPCCLELTTFPAVVVVKLGFENAAGRIDDLVNATAGETAADLRQCFCARAFFSVTAG